MSKISGVQQNKSPLIQGVGGDQHHSHSTINDDQMSEDHNVAPFVDEESQERPLIVADDGKENSKQINQDPSKNESNTTPRIAPRINDSKEKVEEDHEEIMEFDKHGDEDTSKKLIQDDHNSQRSASKNGGTVQQQNGGTFEMQNVAERKTKQKYEDLSENLDVKKDYISRRTKNYEDSQSEDENYVMTEGRGPVDTGNIEYMDTKGNTTVLKPHIRFQPYKHMFKDLLKQSQIVTMWPICSMLITYDSTRALTVTKEDDRNYYIKMYDLESYQLTFEEKIGGSEESYIKLKEVEQRTDGKEYAVVFNDDGVWFLRTFGKISRTQKEIDESQVNINELIGIDNYTMCNEMFPDPFGNCCWISMDQLFIVVFHNYSRTHYHMIYDIRQKKLVGNVTSHVMDCNLKQFPYKSFFSVERNMIYAFYRQGEVFNIDPQDPSKYTTQQIIQKDLGQMIMFGGECLIVRSSGNVYFFKQEVDKMTSEESWQLFHTIKVRGFIYYIKGNIRIQVTTDELIYFYLIDKETFMPTLENVMYNYMGCNQMMFGSKVRYGISYKTNQKSFDIYRRKYMHNLKVNVRNENLEGAFGLSMPNLNIFLVAHVDKIGIYSSTTFEQLGNIPIKLLPTESREPNEIIGMCKSKCDKWLAVISGKNLVMNKQAQNQLFLLKLVQHSENEVKFEQQDRIVVKEFPEFQNVCMKFYFKDFEGDGGPKEMIFCKATEIFTLNIKSRQFTTIHKFRPALMTQPLFYCISEDQQTHVLASQNDGIWFDQNQNEELDLDEHYKIDLIKNITYDSEKNVFYMLCNKKRDELGFFLIKFGAHDPLHKEDIISWKHKLDVGDCDINILRGLDQLTGKHYKELVISYKTIYINTYNVFVQDLSDPPEKSATLYIHESFQLWESSISGIMLSKTKDFVSVSKVGMNVLALGAVGKRRIKDNEGQDKMIHSLDASTFLKIDPLNFIKYECQDYNNRVISIDQEYTTGIKGTDSFETRYHTAYKIKISEVTLRELLILQSFYLCKTQSDIVSLVRLQPTPKFFYKSFLELNLSTMVSILAFDSGSLEHLLNEQFEEYFDSTYPIIFKNKVEKKQGNDFYYRTAIQNALLNNQIGSVNLILEYIIKYQNNYVSANLFMKTLPNLVRAGVKIVPLLESNVFIQTFDYDEWPGNHPNDEENIRPYNYSFFQLRDHYKSVYPERDFDVMRDDISADEAKSMTVYKIKYHINLLPAVGEYYMQDPNDPSKTIGFNVEEDFMKTIAESDEIEIFDNQNIMDIISYKWDAYGRDHHIFGSIMHAFYVFLVGAYICIYYCYEVPHKYLDYVYTGILAIGILFPWFYDTKQLCRDGASEYFSDPWNWMDAFYVYGSFVNIILQFTLGKDNTVTRLVFSFVVLLLIIKTMFFLRIIQSFTPLVIMMVNVIYDLRIFGLFFTILVLIFSLMFSVVGVGLDQIQNETPEEARRRMLSYDTFDQMEKVDYTRYLKAGKARGNKSSANKLIPEEYKFLGMFVGQFMTALRVSIGDFSCIESSVTLDVAENWLFWFLWLIAVIITNIVFLNFIVAEASASYAAVTETLDAVIQRERATLISEAEQMAKKDKKTTSNYPPYLIVRTIET